MFGIRSNSIGIMPAGALGVAFYHHLTANGQDGSSIVFLDRPGGDRREHPLGAGTLHIDYDSTRHEVPSGGLFAGGMIECYAQGRLPELILVAVNPDQIDALLGGIVQLLEYSTRSSSSPPIWSSPRHSGISQRWKTATGTPSADWCQADHYRMPPRSCRRYLLADLG